eukprot:704111-Rhodomonas_salina.2
MPRHSESTPLPPCPSLQEFSPEELDLELDLDDLQPSGARLPSPSLHEWSNADQIMTESFDTLKTIGNTDVLNRFSTTINVLETDGLTVCRGSWHQGGTPLSPSFREVETRDSLSPLPPLSPCSLPSSGLRFRPPSPPPQIGISITEQNLAPRLARKQRVKGTNPNEKKNGPKKTISKKTKKQAYAPS